MVSKVRIIWKQTVPPTQSVVNKARSSWANSKSSTRLRQLAVRVRFHIIRNARIENVGKSQSCMVSKLRIIWKQTVSGRRRGRQEMLGAAVAPRLIRDSRYPSSRCKYGNGATRRRRRRQGRMPLLLRWLHHRTPLLRQRWLHHHPHQRKTRTGACTINRPLITMHD